MKKNVVLLHKDDTIQDEELKEKIRALDDGLSSLLKLTAPVSVITYVLGLILLQISPGR